jgi:hypothetical protein
MRQGGDPRLPLELALVKVTRPGSDLSAESTAYRLEQLEHARSGHGPGTVPVTDSPQPTPQEEVQAEEPPAEPPSLELTQLQEAWQRTVLPAVERRSIPTASMLREAHPAALADDRLTLEFPASAAFHRQLAEEPKNANLLADALFEVTGRRLKLEFALGENGEQPAEMEPPSEEDFVALIKETFDAREVDHE